MTCLFAEPNLAFVQARFDYLNADDNELTGMQMVTLDAHLAIEQATRCWAGHPLPFNGTCGIWRRDAIEAAGGWKGDTVTEDLDLSYRGWRTGPARPFLLTVAVPGELPETMQAWVTQQRRWTKGFGQVTLRMIGPILRDGRLTSAPALAAPAASRRLVVGAGLGRWPCRSASPPSSPIRRCSGSSARC